MRSIRLLNAGGIRRHQPVLLISATEHDRFREDTSGFWHPISNEWWQHGKLVHAVTHHNQLSFARGDTLEIQSAMGRLVAYVEITTIEMAEPSRLTDLDFGETQYLSRVAYDAFWGEGEVARAWAYRLIYFREDEQPSSARG